MQLAGCILFLLCELSDKVQGMTAGGRRNKKLTGNDGESRRICVQLAENMHVEKEIVQICRIK